MKRRVATALLVLFLGAGTATAQEQKATHIVRPGDTLRGLTRQYLGSEDRWRENWNLNPEIRDPNRLVPGQRIRILVPSANSPVPTARVIRISGEVEERPAPVDWLGAQSEDLLLERDGLRTGESSSTALRFTDGTQLVVTEGSLIFMRRAGRTLEGVDERSVEIQRGQAEVAAIDPTGPAAEIEIVIGGTTAKPQAGAGGELQTRARRSEGGGAAVMMYEGAGEVEAAGEKVAVERGMGTAVPEDGPPAPPEKLLPAPAPMRPAPASRLPYPDPEFAWSEVRGAESYVLELCADSECLELRRRQAGLRATSWRSPPLPVATYHWRVTAVSPSGLDGYPSATSALAVLSDSRDGEPPVASFELEGPTVDKGDQTYYAPSAVVRVEVHDRPAGLRSWQPLIDGRPVRRDRLTGGWLDGEHAVDVLASDLLGNQGTRQGPRFTVDAEPPRVIWEVQAEQALGQMISDRPKRWQRRLRAWHRRARRALRRHGADPALWALVAWRTDALTGGGADWSLETLRWRERRRHQSVSHAGGAPAVLVLAPRLELPESGGALGDRVLLLRAQDDKSGARELSLRTVAKELHIVTVDRLGNRRLERAVFLDPG